MPLLGNDARYTRPLTTIGALNFGQLPASSRAWFWFEFQSSVSRSSASNARSVPGCTPLFASLDVGIDAPTMPEPGVLPFADSVSTPPEEPHGDSIVLCDTGVSSNVVPLKRYALKRLQSSDQTYIHGPRPPSRFQ